MDVLTTFKELDTTSRCFCIVGGAALVAVTVGVTRKALRRPERKTYPRDTVILHQIGRGPYAPSMTPFAVKLETYLRMAKIPYQNVHGMNRSSKGKFPWMEYNGEEIADSTLCIDFLNKKLGVDLNKHLSPSEKGVAQAMQVMVEEHLYWCLVLFRWVYDNDKSFLFRTFKMPRLVFSWLIQPKVKAGAYAQGMGRHTEKEITFMMNKDLTAITEFLGDKKFLFGDTACEADCAVFGSLSQLNWQFIGTGHDNIIKDKYPKLAAYCDRMKTTFWPDWDQCITHGGTREATK